MLIFPFSDAFCPSSVLFCFFLAAKPSFFFPFFYWNLKLISNKAASWLPLNLFGARLQSPAFRNKKEKLLCFTRSKKNEVQVSHLWTQKEAMGEEWKFSRALMIGKCSKSTFTFILLQCVYHLYRPPNQHMCYMCVNVSTCDRPRKKAALQGWQVWSKIELHGLV